MVVVLYLDKDDVHALGVEPSQRLEEPSGHFGGESFPALLAGLIHIHGDGIHQQRLSCVVLSDSLLGHVHLTILFLSSAFGVLHVSRQGGEVLGQLDLLVCVDDAHALLVLERLPHSSDERLAHARSSVSVSTSSAVGTGRRGQVKEHHVGVGRVMAILEARCGRLVLHRLVFVAALPVDHDVWQIPARGEKRSSQQISTTRQQFVIITINTPRGELTA
jgi:hypothetical protein